MSSPPANVNEGERRWLLQRSTAYGVVAVSAPNDGEYGIPRGQTIEVVPAKALREAEEEAERLREAIAKHEGLIGLGDNVCHIDRELWAVLKDGPSPSAPSQSSVSEPEAGLDGSER